MTRFYLYTLCFALTLTSSGIAQDLTRPYVAALQPPPKPAQPMSRNIIQTDDDDIFKPLGKISVKAKNPTAVEPEDQSGFLFKEKTNGDIQRDWTDLEFNWAATDFYHRPLYFEYIPAERYGQATHRWVQPFLQGAHFFGTFPILPYKMGLEQPCDRVYTLGYYRPGSYTPRQRQHLPWERRGAFYEASFWVALAFAFP